MDVGMSEEYNRINDLLQRGYGKIRKKKWSKFIHNGPLLAKPYVKHNIPIIHKNERIILPELAEEMATIYAKYTDSEYIKHGTFRRNFWKSWKLQVKPLGIISLEDCDFSLLYKYNVDMKEKRKNRSKEEKKKIKEHTTKNMEEFRKATVDDTEQLVANSVVEPPGIFIGRGCHPKLGTYKRRIQPEDITLNLSKDAPVPKIYYMDDNGDLQELKDKKWHKIIHDNTSEWVATWKENILGKRKYVWLSDTSSFKSYSDINKFNLARKLKKKIHKIREANDKLLTSTNMKEAQLSTIFYLLDHLALRVGNEKGSDVADTVGITSLRVEHIKLLGNNHVTLDFLGKDTIRYLRTFTVDPKVYNNLVKFEKGKEKRYDLFDLVSSTDINQYLQSYMKKLTAKVFRTYNASNVYQKELRKIRNKFSDVKELTKEQLKEIYEMIHRANIKVAKLCNHQKKVVSSFKKQIEKMKERINDLKKKKVKIQRKTKTDSRKKQIIKIKDKIKEIRNKIALKIELKDISLETSKVNYIDPRITASLIKKFNLDPTKLFSSKLIKKFKWAFDEVDENYKF